VTDDRDVEIARVKSNTAVLLDKIAIGMLLTFFIGIIFATLMWFLFHPGCAHADTSWRCPGERYWVAGTVTPACMPILVRDANGDLHAVPVAPSDVDFGAPPEGETVTFDKDGKPIREPR